LDLIVLSINLFAWLFLPFAMTFTDLWLLQETDKLNSTCPGTAKDPVVSFGNSLLRGRSRPNRPGFSRNPVGARQFTFLLAFPFLDVSEEFWGSSLLFPHNLARFQVSKSIRLSAYERKL
jgi:hypothetical protein